MSNIFNQKSYQNYHYRQQRDIPRKVLGTTYDPYQPKISSQVTQEKYIQSLGSTLQRGITPQKPYENNSYKNGRRSSSTAPLINNSYNIINNNPYSRSPNYNTYVNGYTHNRDHVKDLLNLTGKDTLTNFKENNKQGFNNNNINNNINNYTINNLKTINPNSNYEVAKNSYQEYNNRTIDNNKYINKEYNNYNNYSPYNNKNNYTPKKIIEEKISNDSLDSYYEENNSSLIKDLAYKENANARYRDYMEDKGRAIENLNNDENNAIFCLFDGHGGGEVSTYLQKNFSNHMKEHFPFTPNDKLLFFTELFRKIDKKLKELNYFEIGSTAVIIYIAKEKNYKYLYCANIGDSRAILINSNEWKRLSYDDRTSDKNEYDRIIKEGGIVIDGRVNGQLMLTRAFGDWELKQYGVSSEPHVTKVEINNDDLFVVMASDGVWDVMEDSEVYKMSLLATNSKELCNNIMKNTIEKRSMDNISCFVIQLN